MKEPKNRAARARDRAGLFNTPHGTETGAQIKARRR